MEEEDPELEKDLMGEIAAVGDGEDIQMEEDEGEFLDDGELDLPDEEELVHDNEDDLKGEETDSDLEEYYRELGIETEEKGDSYKKKSKKGKKAPVPEKAPVVSREDARKQVLNALITKTREQPTYTALTRVIKIVKQVFFTNNVANENEGGEEEHKKQKKDKTQAISAILLSSASEYRRLLEFFAQEVPKHILKLCSVAEKTNP